MVSERINLREFDSSSSSSLELLQIAKFEDLKTKQKPPRQQTITTIISIGVTAQSAMQQQCPTCSLHDSGTSINIAELSFMYVQIVHVRT